MSEMGTFRIDVEIENPARPGERRRVANVLVDTGAEFIVASRQDPAQLVLGDPLR